MDREIKLSLEPVHQKSISTNYEDQMSKSVKQTDDKLEIALSPEEQKQVLEFSKTINLHDTNSILQYGVGAQSQIAQFSDRTLASVRTKDLGEVGDLLTHVVTELKNFDADEESKGILSFFKKGANKALSLKTKYDKTESNIETISRALNDHQVELMKDVAKLDEMYELNASYFKELSMYILAGKQRLDEVRSTELVSLQEKASQSQQAQDIQQVNDLASAINRFEKSFMTLNLLEQ